MCRKDKKLDMLSRDFNIPYIHFWGVPNAISFVLFHISLYGTTLSFLLLFFICVYDIVASLLSLEFFMSVPWISPLRIYQLLSHFHSRIIWNGKNVNMKMISHKIILFENKISIVFIRPIQIYLLTILFK